MYEVSTVLRASSVQAVRHRRIILSMGPFDHSSTLTSLHSPFFARFKGYVQFIQLNCQTKLLNHNWPCALIERCADLRTLAIIGCGYIIQLDRIVNSVRGTLQKMTLKGFFMFPSYTLYTMNFPNLRILTFDSIQNVLSEDLTTFLATNPNITEINLRKMEFDVTVPFHIIDMLTTMHSLQRLQFSTNHVIDSSVFESRGFISLFFRLQTNVTVILKSLDTEYILSPTNIHKNGLL